MQRGPEGPPQLGYEGKQQQSNSVAASSDTPAVVAPQFCNDAMAGAMAAASQEGA